MDGWMGTIAGISMHHGIYNTGRARNATAAATATATATATHIQSLGQVIRESQINYPRDSNQVSETLG